MRVDPLDVVDPLAGERGQAQADRHDDFAADDEVEFEEEVVVLADGAVDDVLDGYDAGHRIAPGDGLEDLAEGAERGARDVTEGRQDGILGECAGLTGIGDRRRIGARRHSMASGGRCRSRCRSGRPGP